MRDLLSPTPAADLDEWHDRVFTHRYERVVPDRHLGAWAALHLHERSLGDLESLRRVAAALKRNALGHWAENTTTEPGPVRYKIEPPIPGGEPLWRLVAVVLPAGETLIDPANLREASGA